MVLVQPTGEAVANSTKRPRGSAADEPKRSIGCFAVAIGAQLRQFATGVWRKIHSDPEEVVSASRGSFPCCVCGGESEVPVLLDFAQSALY